MADNSLTTTQGFNASNTPLYRGINIQASSEQRDVFHIQTTENTSQVGSQDDKIKTGLLQHR